MVLANPNDMTENDMISDTAIAVHNFTKLSYTALLGLHTFSDWI
jgi:hypothetical protein